MIKCQSFSLKCIIFGLELNESHMNWLCKYLMVRLGLMIRQAVTLELALIDT